jgi:hypothetical protein
VDLKKQDVKDCAQYSNIVGRWRSESRQSLQQIPKNALKMTIAAKKLPSSQVLEKEAPRRSISR